MEGGWIVKSHSYWQDPRGYRKDSHEDVRRGEFDDSKEAVSYTHLDVYKRQLYNKRVLR